jgi:squalene-hopene/tetraprenyl-beta-curcumene cyclase
MGVWLEKLPADLRQRTDGAMSRAMEFLQVAQREDGSWSPLWFGNQSAPSKENAVYGTSRVLTHLSRVPAAQRNRMTPACQQGVYWLLSAQNADGGWGGAPGVASSIEETALAVDALADVGCASHTNSTARIRSEKMVCGAHPTGSAVAEAMYRGADWLIAHTEQGTSTAASPIGLYFAQLWYFEELYPLVFALSALAKVRRLARLG